MIAAIGNCKIFSKIDLKHAFQQLVMDEKSQALCTLITHMGLYRPQRLPYGVASSPALWQQTVDKMFIGLEGTFCFVDDILIAGKDETEHLSRLRSVFELIKNNGLRIRMNKCHFVVASVEYLGFRVDGHEIHKTSDRIKAIKVAKVPENKEELQSFLGLVTFYGRLIPNLAKKKKAHPLYALLKRDSEWNWSLECTVAVNQIKAEITSSRFIIHFQHNLPVKLVHNASS